MMPNSGNPFMQILSAARQGGDPMQVLSNLAGIDPRMVQGINMVRGKTPDQLRQIAENMARQRGVSAEEIARQLGYK